jgi:hypothetical protein
MRKDLERSKAGGAALDPDVKPIAIKDHIAMIDKMTTKLMNAIEKREKYREKRIASGGFGSQVGAASSAQTSGKTIASMGGGGGKKASKMGAVSASMLMGAEEEDDAHRSETDRWLTRNTKRPFG